MLGFEVSSTTRSGTILGTVSDKLYRAVDRVLKQIKIGGLVRIRRKNWPADSGEVGVVIGRTYTTYDPRYNKYKVMVGNELRVIPESNLFPCEEMG